jgi:hypothetical protein
VSYDDDDARRLISRYVAPAAVLAPIVMLVLLLGSRREHRAGDWAANPAQLGAAADGWLWAYWTVFSVSSLGLLAVPWWALRIMGRDVCQPRDTLLAWRIAVLGLMAANVTGLASLCAGGAYARELWWLLTVAALVCAGASIVSWARRRDELADLR